jgi:hypothetical protein
MRPGDSYRTMCAPAGSSCTVREHPDSPDSPLKHHETTAVTTSPSRPRYSRQKTRPGPSGTQSKTGRVVSSLMPASIPPDLLGDLGNGRYFYPMGHGQTARYPCPRGVVYVLPRFPFARMPEYTDPELGPILECQWICETPVPVIAEVAITPEDLPRWVVTTHDAGEPEGSVRPFTYGSATETDWSCRCPQGSPSFTRDHRRRVHAQGWVVKHSEVWDSLLRGGRRTDPAAVFGERGV